MPSKMTQSIGMRAAMALLIAIVSASLKSTSGFLLFPRNKFQPTVRILKPVKISNPMLANTIFLPTLLGTTAFAHSDSSSERINDSQQQDKFSDLSDILRGTCIYLVGMMGSGKSSVGNALAKHIGYRFLDTDEIAEFMIEMPIASFFAQGNEQQFRDLEYQILMEMAQYTRVVIATGGGTVLKNDNWGLLRHGVVVFLDMSPEDIYDRLKADPTQIQKRPLLNEKDPLVKLKELSDVRRDKYVMADVHVKVSPHLSPEEVADLVCSSILNAIEDNPPLWRSWKAEKDKKAINMAAMVRKF